MVTDFLILKVSGVCAKERARVGRPGSVLFVLSGGVEGLPVFAGFDHAEGDEPALPDVEGAGQAAFCAPLPDEPFGFVPALGYLPGGEQRRGGGAGHGRSATVRVGSRWCGMVRNGTWDYEVLQVITTRPQGLTESVGVGVRVGDQPHGTDDSPHNQPR